MGRILVTEEIAEGGLARLRDAGHEVDVRLGLSPEELLQAVPGAEAMIIRSATQVTESVLDAAQDLIVVGRAGIGVDNVDVAAATRRGVMVVNAPQSNILSAAEHTVDLMSLEELVATADFLTVHLPKTPETLGIIGRDLLRQAKPGLRLVNTARGGIVDEDALAWAVQEGIVAGAGLDVFAEEPTTSS